MPSENPTRIDEIGDFRIEERLGAGGMGVVYRARQLSLDRVVALKVLGNALTREGDIIRFKREAQVVAKLNHPRIATIYSVGQADATCYAAMEFIDGPSLRQVMDCLCTSQSTGISLDSPRTLMQGATKTVSRFSMDLSKQNRNADVAPEVDHDDGPSLSQEAEAILRKPEHIKRACEIVRAVAEVLDYAHGRSVVHRDIKPENLLLDQDGQVHVIDFGIARFFEEATITHTGQIVGTPLYMSPEQVTGRGSIDHRTDIYSLGMVLYELLTLRPPWPARTTAAVIRTIVTKELPPVSWKNRAVPTGLEAVVHKATAKDPDERYQTAAELATDLDRALLGKEVSAHPYRYRYNADEIAASRPLSVLIATVVFFSSSMLCWLLGLYNVLSAVTGTRIAGYRTASRTYDTYRWYNPEYWEQWIRPFFYKQVKEGLVLLVVALAAYLVGSRLLVARGWGRSLGVVLALCTCVYCGWRIVELWKGPRGFISVDVGVRATIIAVSVLATGMLLTRSTREWFGLARKIRTESRKPRNNPVGSL